MKTTSPVYYTLIAGLSALFLVSSQSARAADAPSPRPNIILILADDLGLGNVSCYGADNFKTPNIDALAQGGMRFLRAYGTPVCGVSRGELLSGRYPFRTGIVGNAEAGRIAKGSEILIPAVIKSTGYATASIGKWAQLPFEPSDWGFDEYLRFVLSGKYWNTQGDNKFYTLNGKQVPLPDNVYLPDVMHNYAVDFLQRHKDKPFFLYYPMSNVHEPILRTPDSAPNSTNFYADNVAYMDKLVGKLIKELDTLGLRQKTLVIFCGDNGTAFPFAAQSTIHGQRLSGQKNTLLDGGSHIPFIVNWPGTTPAGTTNDQLIDFTDIMPTIAALTGAKLPQGVVLDGHSIVPQIEGKPGVPREYVYLQTGKTDGCILDRDWKLDRFQEFFSEKGVPFTETLIKSPEDMTAEATAARQQLYATLVKFVGVEGTKNGSESILTYHMKGPDRSDDQKKKKKARKQKAAEDAGTE